MLIQRISNLLAGLKQTVGSAGCGKVPAIFWMAARFLSRCDLFVAGNLSPGWLWADWRGGTAVAVCPIPSGMRQHGAGASTQRRILMSVSNLQDLFLDELRDLLSCESQIIKALPKMAKKAKTPDLQQAFENHLQETKGHVERLNQIFEKMGERARAKKCKGMEGIIEEGKEMMEEAESDEVMDAILISAAQKVEHYEMASYGAVRNYAKLLGDDQAAKLLQQTLDEEGQADKKLTALAAEVNAEAQQMPSEA
jgi:ferritin-like metal-binding protein YciE